MTSLSKENYNPEEYLLDTLNDLDIGFVKVSNDGVILNHNLTYNKIFGFDPEKNLIGTKTLDYWLNPEEKKNFREILYKNGIVKKFIAPAKKVDGENIVLQINIKINKNSKGEIISSEGTFTEMTERIETEQKLKESEEKYRNFVQNIQGIAFQGYQDFSAAFFDGTVEEITGYTTEDFITGRIRWDQIIYSDDVLIIQKKVEIFQSTSAETDSREYRIVRKNGEIRWVLEKIQKIYDNIKKLEGVQGIIVDITQRKKVENELTESEEKYSNLFQYSNDAIIIHDFVGNILEVNDRAIELFKYPKEEFLALTTQMLRIIEEQEKGEKVSEEISKKGFIRFEFYFKRKDGTVFPAEVSSRAIEIQGKKSIQAVIRDITDRKDSEERLKRFMESAPNTFMLYDSDLNLIDINKIGIKRFPAGTKKEDIIGKNIVELSPDVKKKGRYDEYMEVIKTGKPFFVEEFTPHPKFGNLHISLNAFKVLNGLGIIARDNTERKKAEEALKESEQRLKEAQALGKIGYWEFDITNQQITWSDQVFELYNRDPSLGPPSVEEEATYYTPDTSERLKEYSRRALEFGEEFDYDFQANLPSGKVVQLTALMRSIKNKSGQTIKLVGTVQDITERKKTEQKLKESEKKLKMIFENANDAISIHDLKGNFYTVNKTYCERLGYTKEELLKLPPKELNTPEYADLVASRVLEIKEKGFGFFEAAHKTKDGRVIPVEISSKSIQYDNKPSILSIIRDITERKKVEQILKESEEKFRTAVENSPDFIVFIKRDGTIFDVNHLEKGYTREMVIGQSVFNENFYETEDHCETARKAISNSLETGEITQYEYSQIAPDASLSFYETIVSPFEYDDEDRIISSQLTTRNITERKKKEKEIIDLAQFPSENPYPILRVNRDGIMYINDAGQKLLNIVDSDQVPEIFQDSVKNTFENNQISESEVEFDNRVYSFTIAPIKDADYVNIYGMDITERKLVEENLKEVNKLKSEFLRRASHELKTPLISIKGFSELILTLHEDQLDSPIISKLREINDGCERLQNIINNLLKASRLESPELKPKFQKEDLSFLIKFCVHELESLVERRNHSIKLDIHSELYANIEKEEIHDVLSNLLINAIKYTPPRGKIEVKTKLKEDFVVVSVKDNGIGFTEQQKTKIFQQFGKIERYGQGLDLGIDGTGLGLYISKRIAEAHGGKIWMESEGKSRGSTFYFTLPMGK